MPLTSEADKANRRRGVKSVWVCPGGQVGLPGSEVKSGWRAGCRGWEPLGKHSLLSQTQQIYERAGVRERARKDERARKGGGKMVKEV